MKLVRVPLRISFAGGGSDLPSHSNIHGGAVCSVAIDKYIYISVKEDLSLFPHRFRLAYSKVEKTDFVDQIEHPILKQVLSEYGCKSLDLDTMSDVPAGTGLGSSSAFTVGLHAALTKTPTAYKKYLADRACHTEIHSLKEPIGRQDQYAAAFGGLNLFEFSVDDNVRTHPIKLCPGDSRRLNDSLHLVYLGGTRSASQILGDVQSRDNTLHLQTMAALAQHAAHALRKGSIDNLGHIMWEGWSRKRLLSPHVSTPQADELITAALASGATGGKLLGAGGAGFVLLFCPIYNTERMKHGLSKLNPRYVPFGFDQQGVTVLYAD